MFCLHSQALFLSLSSIILAFAFMIGSASSKMFEGWLFILLQRPVSASFANWEVLLADRDADCFCLV